MPFPFSEFNPFVGISADSTTRLRKAGWIPRKYRCARRLRHPLVRQPWYSFQRSRFPLDDIEWLKFVRKFGDRPANDLEVMRQTAVPRQIVAELVGLVVNSRQGIPTKLIFDPTLALEDEELVTQAGELLGERLIPIGELASQAFLVIAESQRVFLIAFVDFGILFAGETFASAMNELLQGRRVRPVVFDSSRDPNGMFTFPDVATYGSFVYDLENQS